MNKIMTTIVIILLSFLVLGCDSTSVTKKIEEKEELLTREEREQLSINVMNYIVDGEIDEFILLFSKYVQENYDLRTQIEGIEGFFDGAITEYDTPSCRFSGSESDEEGCYEYTLEGCIYNVITENGKEYLICFNYYEIHPDGPYYEGISTVSIRCVSEYEGSGYLPEEYIYNIGETL